MAEAALAIGGWFASATVSMLSDSFRSFISGRYQAATGVRRQLETLDTSVGKIKAVIGAVEKGITEDPNILSWLHELKDAVYDAEDVFDLFNIENPRRSVEASGSMGSSSVLVGAKRKFVELEVSAKRFFFPDDSLRDLSDIINKFDRLDIGTFLEVVKHSTDSYKEGESSEWRQTSPVPAVSEMFGRRWAQDRLLELVSVSSDKKGSNSDNFSVVSIVGIGGMGKTTLAQWLYNLPSIKNQNLPIIENQFDLMAWVCVSDRFNMREVMIKIFESASKRVDQNLYNRKNFGTIHEDLSILLSGKKFLIVLDDVWDDMTTTDWDKLISVFRCGKEGSKIVVSTRDRRVADKVGSVDTIDLAGLEDEEFWQLFKCCAFGDGNPKDHPKLEHIGKQIASKLGGMPLAAKLVGGVLKRRLEERHWRDILEDKEWKKEDAKDKILLSLRLSYNHLPLYLKQCFLYCALFPKDYRFKVDKLVNIWVAQGYVQSTDETKTLEDVGREYFNELHSRSFFQQNPLDIEYVHDLLDDLAESIGDEIYREENCSSVELKIPNRVRHLFVNSGDLDKVLGKIKKPKKLRSLVYNPPRTSNISNISYHNFNKLRGLRVLILGEHCSSSYLPETISHLLHLRYLEFPLGIKLPISLGMLYNLQVLALSNDGAVSENIQFIDASKSMFRRFNYQTALSEIFGKLTNLRYINAPYSLISAIPSIGKLTSLQRLERYEVRKQEGYNICELRNLNQIKGSLQIDNLENVANKEEAKKAQLDKKAHLKKLTLRWNSNHSSNEEIRVQEEVLEGLQPHSNIKSIHIYGYMGLEHPSWLNRSYLSNIESISLEKCGSLKVLP